MVILSIHLSIYCHRRLTNLYSNNNSQKWQWTAAHRRHAAFLCRCSENKERDTKGKQNSLSRFFLFLVFLSLFFLFSRKLRSRKVQREQKTLSLLTDWLLHSPNSTQPPLVRIRKFDNTVLLASVPKPWKGSILSFRFCLLYKARTIFPFDSTYFYTFYRLRVYILEFYSNLP